MKKCVVLTGAGISADSGIQTFRDSGGLWEGYPVEDVATPEGYAKNPALVLDFYNQRRRQLKEVVPNSAHLALVELESKYDVQIITQNIDDLHERAGSKNIIHLHGELNKVRSTFDENNVLEWTEDLAEEDKDQQGYPLRPHIVWFGEAVPLFDEAIYLTQQADILLIIGTSLQVYPAASLLHWAPKDAPIYLVDKHPTEVSKHINVIAKRASEGVPELVKELLT